MNCCCTKVYRVCDVIQCDESDLVFPIPIPADGEYTLELDFLNDVIRETVQLSAGNNATFSKRNLNERFTYVGHVLNASGEKVTFTIDGQVYDCIEFTTKRAIINEFPANASSS
jgi:hypothetical protein